MNIETLISMVYARPPLWDKKNKLRGDRNVIDKFWRQISIEMKEDEGSKRLLHLASSNKMAALENKLRKKWKYLRDQFSVELGKFPPGDDGYRPKWIHFDSLLFLKEMVKPRELIKKPKHVNRRRRSSTSAASDDPGADSSVEDSQSEHDMSILELLDQEASSSSTKRKIVSDDNGHGTAKKVKKSFTPETDHDENLFFFKSLLPHVRKIQENKVLSFRNRIQEVVEEFAYRSEIEDVKLF